MNFQTDIVKRIQEGDERAFELVFRSLYAILCTFANKYLKDTDQAEEVVQEVFYNYWNKRESLEITGILDAYLYSSVRNACLNHLKHQDVRKAYNHAQQIELKAEEQRPKDSLLELELEEKIEGCLSQLPTERQKIFRMSREDDQKYQEIANKLGISIKTVEAQMGKALKSLRECLKDYLSIMIGLILCILYYS